MTNALHYPPADRTTQWFGPANATVTPNKILWHTTETAGGWPGYSAGASAPNLTYDPWLHQWRQHFPLNGTSRALADGKDAAGKVVYSTNRQGTVQIEISCTNGWNKDAAAKGRAVWNLDDQAIGDLADFSRFMFDEWAVPLTTGVAWPTYPVAPARLTPAQFTAYKGQLGHMHAPYQDHSDPGGLAVQRILALAQGDDMALTDEDKAYLRSLVPTAKQNADALLGTRIKEYGDRLVWDLIGNGAVPPPSVDVDRLADALKASLGSAVADELADRLKPPTP